MRFWDRKCKKNKRFIENLIIDWVIVMIVKGYCMKKTLFIILSFVYFALACYSSDNAAPIPKLNQNETKALNLAIELIEKLSANTPFSREEGKKFFGDTGNFYGHTLSFYCMNGLVDIKTESKNGPAEVVIKKDLPSLSFFGEILRIYRNIFIDEDSKPLFSVENKYYVNNNNAITYFGEEMVSILIRPNLNKSTQISLLYSVKHGYFFFFFSVNEIPLFVYLKLASADKPNKISEGFLNLMKTYILSK